MGHWHLAGLVGIFAESLFACMYGCTNTPGGICETMKKTLISPCRKVISIAGYHQRGEDARIVNLKSGCLRTLHMVRGVHAHEV